MGSLKALFSYQVKFKTSVFIITIAVASIAMLSIPIKVTVDGINYISSARALFSPEMPTHYVWYREPGYPLILRLIHNVSSSGDLLLFTQALFLGLASGISFYVLRKSAGQANSTIGQIALAVILVANPLFLIYAGLVLQQALFAFILSLYALVVFWSFQPLNSKNKIALVVGSLTLYVCSIVTSIGWIYLGLLPTATVLIVVVANSLGLASKKSKLPVQILKMAATGLTIIIVFVGTYLLGTQTYNIWDRYKQINMPQSYEMPNVIKPLDSAPYIPTPLEISSRMLSIMSIGLQEHYTYENTLFLNQQMRRIWPMAEWDTAYVSLPYSEYAKGYFSLPNPNVLAQRAVSYSSVIASNTYRVIFLLSYLTLLLSIVRKKWLFILVQLIPIYFIFVYAASNSPIDRYGIPAFPFAAGASGILITWVIDFISKKFKKLRAKIA